MSTWEPYYRRDRPAYKANIALYKDRRFVRFFDGVPLPAPDGGNDLVEAVNDARDERAQAVIAARSGDIGSAPTAGKLGQLLDGQNLSGHACLGVLTYLDYFYPATSPPDGVKTLVANAIAAAQPGWSGTYGKDAKQLDLVGKNEGNYDMGQMFQLAIAYGSYNELDAVTQTKLITELLGNAKIDRINLDRVSGSGPLPNDWYRTGYIKWGIIPPFVSGWGPGFKVKDIDETENHILTMLAARYLTNQLLFQRTQDSKYDNRRNGLDGAPACTQLVLQLLRNVLSDDFSEYNAKDYQEETRWALLTLSTYAYDAEVRLAARMVLDYLSAKMVVSSSDLRRLLPFRRRNGDSNNSAHDADGFTTIGVVFRTGADIDHQLDPSNSTGADPMLPYYALQVGNTRACQVTFSGKNNTRGMPEINEVPLEIVSDYRVPDPIVDLFVNNNSRRFFQRLHRRIISNSDPGQSGGNRTADNMEIYAGSPSYLITAGSAATDYAIDPHLPPWAVALLGTLTATLSAWAGLGGLVGIDLLGAGIGELLGIFTQGIAWGDVNQEKGAAVSTSFMPAIGNEKVAQAVANFFGPNAIPDRADQLLVQFGFFSDDMLPADSGSGVANYGVAPDFACGYAVRLPGWLDKPTVLVDDGGGWSFADFGSTQPGLPGFCIALFRSGKLALLEAFDTLLHPDVTFDSFKTGVRSRNPGLELNDNQPATYKTSAGNEIQFVIWTNQQRRGAQLGAEVLSVTYADPSAPEARGDAGNKGAEQTNPPLVNGTVLNSDGDAVITIYNPLLDKTIRLDLSDMWNPRRTDENGSVEQAGGDHDIWTDFDWKGLQEGDVFRPFATLKAGEANVADGGTIRMIPSDTTERDPIGVGKRFTLIAPIGQVKVGVV